MADQTQAAILPRGEDRDRIIAPPSQGYVTGEDNLRVTSFNSQSGVTVSVSGRLYDLATREIIPIDATHVPNTDRTVKQTLHRLGKGFVLNLMARATAGSPVNGQTYVILELVRGLTGATTVVGVLGADSVTARQGIAWPGSLVVNSLDTRGALRSVTGSTPAAGAEISETVPTGARYEIIAFTATLTTSATVASRFARLSLDDGTNTYFRCPFGAAQTASTVFVYTWFEGGFVTTYADPGANAAGVPVNNEILAGHRMRTITANIQAGDQWTAPQFLVRERLEAA